MHGDPDLPTSFPQTYKFLNRFKGHLEKRSSLKRFQKGQAFYSLWSTGPYTFSPFKVLWREIGKKFAAAYIGSASMASGEVIVVPDHKLYFIPVDTEQEAAYLTGFLNAPTISNAVSSYGAQLSLGASVPEYLRIPQFDETNVDMAGIAKIAREITLRGGAQMQNELHLVDIHVRALLGI
jgi:hypothetical protein